MGLWIGTKTVAANDHGVFAMEATSPVAVTPIGTGTVGLVGTFPWGPDDTVIEPTDTADRIMTIAPLGMDRTGSGYMAALGKAWPDLRLARALGSAAAKASAALPNSTPATSVTVQMKFKGVAGNSIVATVKTATDGDANHFDLDVSVTNADGSTIESWQNLNYSGTGADSAPNVSQSRLVGAITKTLAGRPVNGSYTATGGTDGTINAASYLGTPGTGDKGLALFEGTPDIDVVFPDDCGNTLRAAVNAGVVAHANLMGDRLFVINGNSGQTAAAAQTDVLSYTSVWGAYVDPWYYQRDDNGVERLCSPAAALAVIMANLSPSTSPAWKATEVRALIGFITRLESQRGANAKGNAKGGICTILKQTSGGHAFHAAVVTAALASPSKKDITRSRMGIFIAKSVLEALPEMVDAPNVPANQDAVIGAIQSFMNNLRDAQKEDPNHNAHVVDWGWLDLKALNPLSSIQAGEFTPGWQVLTSAAMEKIFPTIEFGPTVIVKASAGI
jgi:phage tail sheath protein FI